MYVIKTNGSPEFPRQPCECMHWSLTPVVTSTLAIAYPGLLPSGFLRPSAFTSKVPEAIMWPRLPSSGLNTEPAPLIHLASDSRYRAYPQTSLLTCRLGFDQVGLATIAATHPLVRNNQFLSRMGFPRLWIYLGTTGRSLPPEVYFQIEAYQRTSLPTVFKISSPLSTHQPAFLAGWIESM